MLTELHLSKLEVKNGVEHIRLNKYFDTIWANCYCSETIDGTVHTNVLLSSAFLFLDQTRLESYLRRPGADFAAYQF